MNIEIKMKLHLDMKFRSVVSVCRSLRQFSSSGKFDFTDLTSPHTWYPVARRKKCNIVLHVGPTNSGKTYHALKQLETSSSGLYCGPLRLLAWEVAKKEEVEGAKHKYVTVEMADLSSDYQCAVVDEIQMVGCKTRGFSFTRALLGIPADELHLCGNPAAVPLIQQILKVQYYDRLSPLVPSKVPLGSFSNIQRGDCIVTFSRREIYRLKKEIEFQGKHLCSVVYGSLPPETRTRQEGHGSKFPRGEVTCIDREDLPLLHSALGSPSPILECAGLFPTFDLLYLYSRLHPNAGFHQILEEFLHSTKLSANYFISNCEEMLKVAAVLDDLPLGIHDKYLFFCNELCKKRYSTTKEIFTPGTLKVPTTQAALKELESIHKVLDLYVWLSFRIEDSFPDHEVAASQKSICNLLIEDFLERLGSERPSRRRLPTPPIYLKRNGRECRI
ncbi:hypothetical protein MKX01_013878 [Papaver californicum]|nr:hypothetical protein MKX01_013878 [Papaver californicum]